MSEQKHLMNFDELSGIATALNHASDELGNLVNVLDDSLQPLNIGITAWFTFAEWRYEDSPSNYEYQQLGYAKIDGKWRIGIRRLVGDDGSPDPDEVRDIWPFNDAPRELRLQAIEKLPDVIDKLAKAALEMTQVANKKVAEARAFAAVMGLLPANDAKKTARTPEKKQ